LKKGARGRKQVRDQKGYLSYIVVNIGYALTEGKTFFEGCRVRIKYILP
jgi:hypothetical protein